MSLASDEDAVGALAPGGGDSPLADHVCPRRLNGCLMIRVPAAVKTASDAPVYLASRSLIRDFGTLAEIHGRWACCAVHTAARCGAGSGLRVDVTPLIGQFLCARIVRHAVRPSTFTSKMSLSACPGSASLRSGARRR